MSSTDVYAAGATALAALTGAEPETLPHRGLHVDVRGALQGRISPALIGSLEQMLEPDPDRRAKSLAAALDGVRSEPPTPPPPPPVAALMPRGGAKEDAAVKSVRKLLWLLWGLGWIIVPLIASHFHAQRAIPLIMFVSLAALFIATWHKGALLRMALRALVGGQGAAVRAVPQSDATPRHRVDIGPNRQVRVHTTDRSPEELVGQTELQSEDLARRMRRARR